MSTFNLPNMSPSMFMPNNLPNLNVNPNPMTLFGPMTTPTATPGAASGDIYGLLGVDRNNARTMGLLAAASAFLDAGAGGRNPQDASLGRAAGRAALGGMGAYQNALRTGLAEQVAGLQARKMLSDQAASTRDAQMAQRLGIPTSALPAYYKAAIERQFPKQEFMTITEENAALFGFTPKEVEEARKSGRALQIGRSGEINSVALRQVPLVQMGGESSLQKETSKILARDFDEIRKAANNADITKQNAEIGFQLLPKDSGTGRELKGKLDEIIATGATIFGFSISPERTARITDLGGYRAFLEDNVLAKLASQKGPQTDLDADRARRALMSADNPMEANRIIRDYQIALADRAIELRDFLVSAMSKAEPGKKGDAYNKAKTEWSKFTARTPLVARITQNGVDKIVFLSSFVRQTKAANPNASREAILEAWRREAKKGRQ